MHSAQALPSTATMSASPEGKRTDHLPSKQQQQQPQEQQQQEQQEQQTVPVERAMESTEDSELDAPGAVQLYDDATGIALDADEGERPYQSRTTLMEVGACYCNAWAKAKVPDKATFVCTKLNMIHCCLCAAMISPS